MATPIFSQGEVEKTIQYDMTMENLRLFFTAKFNREYPGYTGRLLRIKIDMDPRNLEVSLRCTIDVMTEPRIIS